ncbi:MAG: hypothetical protein AABZ47_13840 [Planctomycetota bacterium]
MVESVMVVFPWDLMDEGIESVLDRLQGEVGVSGIDTWVGCPAVTRIRPRNVFPRVIRNSGGLYFAPTETHYAATRCKPVLAEGLKGQDVLRRAMEACQERGLKLRAVVSTSRTGRLAHRYPEMACKNVFAARSEQSVCLSNPDVQAYLEGLVRDLSSHDSLAGIVLADVCTAWADAYTEEWSDLPNISTDFRHLLAICFCESCLQKANAVGVDASNAMGAAQEIMDRALEKPSQLSGFKSEELSEDHPIRSFQRWQERELNGVLRRLQEATEFPITLLDPSDPHAVHWPMRPRFNCDALSSVLRPIERDTDSKPMTDDRSIATEILFPACWLLIVPSEQIVKTVEDQAQRKIQRIVFDHYGALTEDVLTNIRRGIRFAKRG